MNPTIGTGPDDIIDDRPAPEATEQFPDSAECDQCGQLMAGPVKDPLEVLLCDGCVARITAPEAQPQATPDYRPLVYAATQLCAAAKIINDWQHAGNSPTVEMWGELYDASLRVTSALKAAGEDV